MLMVESERARLSQKAPNRHIGLQFFRQPRCTGSILIIVEMGESFTPGDPWLFAFVRGVEDAFGYAMGT
jgi:uncharacterized membrane protein